MFLTNEVVKNLHHFMPTGATEQEQVLPSLEHLGIRFLSDIQMYVHLDNFSDSPQGSQFIVLCTAQVTK